MAICYKYGMHSSIKEVLDSLKENNVTLKALNEDTKQILEVISSMQNNEDKKRILDIFGKLCDDLEHHVDSTDKIIKSIGNLLRRIRK